MKFGRNLLRASFMKTPSEIKEKNNKLKNQVYSIPEEEFISYYKDMKDIKNRYIRNV